LESYNAARLCGVEIEVRGRSPKDLQSWLWDFDARPLSSDEQSRPVESAMGKVGFIGALHKTGAFMEAHPFGTVPAAFSPDGKIGVFESNSIMRAVARLAKANFHYMATVHTKPRGSIAFWTRVWCSLETHSFICWR
jgi:hypothetical protein